MKRARNTVKPVNNQRSISSYFSQPSVANKNDKLEGTSKQPVSRSRLSLNKIVPNSQTANQPMVKSDSSIVSQPAASQNTKRQPETKSSAALSPTQQTKKNGRNEPPCPGSPDTIPPTPPSKAVQKHLPVKNKRLSHCSKKSNNSECRKSNGTHFERAMSNLQDVEKEGTEEFPQLNPAKQRKKEATSGKQVHSPSKVYDDCNHLQTTSQVINLNKQLTYPVNTDDDKVLQSMLKQLTPNKFGGMNKADTDTGRLGHKDNKVSSKRKSMHSPIKIDDKGSCLGSAENVKNSKRQVTSSISIDNDEALQTMLEQISNPKKVAKVDKYSIACRKRIDTENVDQKLSVKGRKSIQSPLAPEVRELKYPPLLVTLENFKAKSSVKDQAMSSLKEDSSSSLKKAAGAGEGSEMLYKSLAGQETKITQENNHSPIRRSPRKHPSSAPLNQEIKQIENGRNSPRRSSPPKSCKTSEVATKENRNLFRFSPRRSPRKQHLVSSLKSSPKEYELPEGVSTNDLSCTSMPKVSSVSNLTNAHEWNDASDEHDDVTSYLANMKEEEVCPLDLHEAHICKVVSITVVTPFKEALLYIKSVEKHKRTASCRVQGCWLGCPVSEGDVISLQAVRVEQDWLLDDNKGFLVIHPDLLISGTMVVGSLFCSRRSVLSNLFRGMDSDSPIMVIGSLVHQLLQMALLEKKSTEAELRQLSEQLISSKQSIHMLYAANMTLAQIQKELSHFIPRIVDFFGRYVVSSNFDKKGKNSSWLNAPSAASSLPTAEISKGRNSKDWQGKIIGIRDIEETLWEPKLGIKGMVDVSVEVQDSHGNKKVMPLELKTGKASFSAEHRGQVTLYTMMMSRMGQAIDSGLLLYLRDGQVQEVSVSKHERKDLLQLRNTLAHYLLPRLPIFREETGRFLPLKLPEPISFENACKKCPYATLCSIYLKEDGLSDLPTDHPMVSISSNKSQGLSQSHIDYFMHWVGLLLLEEADQLRSSNLRHIWRFSPEEREKSKRAIVNLHLMKPGVEKDKKYYHVFNRKLCSTSSSTSTKDLRDCGLGDGDYILISTDSRIAIERGNIISIDSSSVTVTTHRNLFDRYANETFHLDISDINTSLVFNLTNLGCLLDEKEAAERLRGIIIDKVMPTFSSKTDKTIIQRCLSIFKKLNRNQRNALVKTLQANSYLLIKGLPGTGKTATMVALVELLVQVGMSVLVTSHTHSAVDNLLLRLKKAGLKFLRLGPDARIHPQIRPYSESSLTQHCKTPEDLDKVFSQQQIVGVTCLGAGHAMLSQQRIFDVCLVDESTQVLQPSILRPLFCARRFVLVGDPEQLPPIVRCHQAQAYGLGESLFARLDSQAATVSLTLNYRMNRVITELANGLTYGGELLCGSKEVAEATLHLTSHKVHVKPWLSKALSTDIDNSVVFIDTSEATASSKEESSAINVDTNGDGACCNRFELTLVMELINALIDGGVVSEEIGVIAPYRAQVALLSEAIKTAAKFTDVEVNTVDQFQGRDKQVIVYSCTKSGGVFNQLPKEREILNDQRRLTVAITRAKHKLVLVGHSKTLNLYAPFKKLFSCFCMNNIVSVYDEE